MMNPLGFALRAKVAAKVSGPGRIMMRAIREIDGDDDDINSGE